MSVEKLRVLVVDDDPRFLDVMRSSLESKKCDVTCVSDGQIALSLLIKQIFHVVFIDCVLHSCKGTEIVQEIRKLLGHSVQIIMMSGVIPEKSLSSYIDVGICDFLSKPISDKEIEANLRKIKEKYIYGTQNNLLVRLFSSSIPALQTLKFLISLEKVKDYEFFFYLSCALSSKESFDLKFRFNDKKHEILLNKGNIIDYKCNDSNIFIQRLLSKNFINTAESTQLRGLSQEDIVNFLITNCILSLGQLFDLKYDLLIETLKEITSGVKISVDFNLRSLSSEKNFVLLERSEYADIVFLFLKQKFNNQLFSLFEEDIMNKHLVFKDECVSYLPEIESFIADLKSGIKLKGIYDKYIGDKNLFCFYIIYILLKGNVYLSESNVNVKHQYLYERYKKLYNFIKKAKTVKEVFMKLSGAGDNKALNPAEVKLIFNDFLQHNHPDKIGYDLPSSFLNIVNKTITTLKNKYERENDPNFMLAMEEKRKKDQIEQEILLNEKKKIIERDLETKNYKKAYSLLESVPKEVLNQETEWQLIYLWFHFKNKELFEKNKEEVHKFMKVIQAKKRDLQKNKLFCFVLGLYHFNKNNYGQASVYFNQTKDLDPSFQPSYPEIKKCSVVLLKEKKSTQSFMEKLKTLTLTDIKRELVKSKQKKRAS
ncbi:MAG: response regulator [Oligoflexia bacterium]|nr:response regulator [Oligoflexia bacterium]